MHTVYNRDEITTDNGFEDGVIRLMTNDGTVLFISLALAEDLAISLKNRAEAGRAYAVGGMVE